MEEFKKEKHISKRKKEMMEEEDTKIFYNKDGEEVKRQPVEVWTRVMGYHRPVSQYNLWKKSEFYSRRYFEEDDSENSKFIKDYTD